MDNLSFYFILPLTGSYKSISLKNIYILTSKYIKVEGNIMSFIYMPINIAVLTQISLANQFAVLSHNMSQSILQGNISWLTQH